MFNKERIIELSREVGNLQRDVKILYELNWQNSRQLRLIVAAIGGRFESEEEIPEREVLIVPK